MYMFLISSGILILLVMSLRRLARKKISPILQYSLWLLVAVRLLLPFQLGSSVLSIENFLPQKAQVQEDIQSPVIPQFPTQQVQEQLPTEQILPEVILPTEESLLQEVSPVEPRPDETQTSGTAEVMPSPSVEQTQAVRFSLSTGKILKFVWFAGSAIMALWFLCVNIRFQTTAVKNAKRIDVPQIPLPVYESENIPSPCMVGLFRPRIFLLPGDDPTRRTHILTHEYAHYRHRDHIWSFLRGLCLCIHWYNPLVWIAAYLSREDCEMACDYSAVKALGEEERCSYGRSVLATLVQARQPSNLLRSATTMGGTKKQMEARIDSIAFKPKKVLWVAISLLLVLALAVGCTFTGGKAPTHPPEEEIAETTVPTEETTDTLAEDETLLDDSILANLYEDSTYELFSHYPYAIHLYKDENYEIPQVVVSNQVYDNQINAEIAERFGAILESGDSPYKSVSYRWNIATLDGVDCQKNIDFTLVLDGNGNGDPTRRVFLLDITAVDHQNNTETISYYIDLSTGEPLTASPYAEDIREAVTHELIRELYDEYANTGKLSFTEEDRGVYKENLAKAVESAAIKVLSHNSVTFTVPYVTTDGSVRDLDLNPMPTESISVNALYEPGVIDLYAYTAEDGSQNIIPFILLDNDSGIKINTTVLETYLYYLPSKLSYTWAVNGDMASFSIKAEDPYTYDLICHAGNAFLDPGKAGIPDAGYVLSHAKVPMTYDEYHAQAKVLLRSYFFDLFPGISEAFPNDSLVKQRVLFCGYDQNIEESVPYLDKNGNVWVYARIYQIAGSSSTLHLIPISTGKINEEYVKYAEENNLFLQGEQALLKYLQTLYGEGTYDLIYSAENAYPEYVDDKLHAEGLDDHVLIRIVRKLEPTMTNTDIEAIPELKAACEMLGVDKIEYFMSNSSPANGREMYVMNSTDVTFTGPIDRYVKVVWDTTNKEVHILIYWG